MAAATILKKTIGHYVSNFGTNKMAIGMKCMKTCAKTTED